MKLGEKIREVAISSAAYDRATVSSRERKRFSRDRRRGNADASIKRRHGIHRTYSAASLPRKFYEPIRLLISISSARRDKTRVRQSGYSGLPGVARFADQLRLFPYRSSAPGKGGKGGEGLKGDLSCFSGANSHFSPPNRLLVPFRFPSTSLFFSSAVAGFLPRNHCKFVSRANGKPPPPLEHPSSSSYCLTVSCFHARSRARPRDGYLMD